MASITNAYALRVTSIGKLLEEIKKAAVPPRFSQEFLTGLGFTSSNDRLLIPVLKGVGFLDQSGVPTEVYKEYRDPTKSRKILGRQIRTAYSGLFELNTEAQGLSGAELKGKISSLTSQGENVVKNMAATFIALTAEADFADSIAGPITDSVSGQTHRLRKSSTEMPEVDSPALPPSTVAPKPSGIAFSHTLYINLPATRDVAVYDAIFKALKEHLM